jgi:hypothetical protein
MGHVNIVTTLRPTAVTITQMETVNHINYILHSKQPESIYLHEYLAAQHDFFSEQCYLSRRKHVDPQNITGPTGFTRLSRELLLGGRRRRAYAAADEVFRRSPDIRLAIVEKAFPLLCRQLPRPTLTSNSVADASLVLRPPMCQRIS